MKSLDFFALSFALAGTACLVSKGYEALQYDSYSKKFVASVQIDESYIIKKLQRKEASRIALAAAMRKANIEKCKRDFNCKTMAEAIYFEARGESAKGQISVGQVILERTVRRGFSNTIYGVVNQKNDEGVCHFSYICDIAAGRISRKINNGAAYTRALEYAAGVIQNKYPKYVKNADHYYNPTKVKQTPNWVSSMTQTAYIGNHRYLSSDRSYNL